MKHIHELIKEHVTGYSAEIPSKFHHGDEISVGGRVISVFDANLLSPGLRPVEDDAKDFGVYIVLDDGLGEIQLTIFQSMYRRLLEESDGDIMGKLIVGTGQYIVISKSTAAKDFRGRDIIIPTHPDKEERPKVFGFDVKQVQPIT